MQEHGWENSEHSMNICIEIVKEIHKISTLDSNDFEPLILTPPFKNFFPTSNFLDTEIECIQFHATDPPVIESPSLIGIVRIIS